MRFCMLPHYLGVIILRERSCKNATSDTDIERIRDDALFVALEVLLIRRLEIGPVGIVADERLLAVIENVDNPTGLECSG
jgi:hypothetical protein